MPLWSGGPNTRTLPEILLTLPPSEAADMAHLCVPQNQALGICRGFVPDIQVCGTQGREDLVNATTTSNAEEEEEGNASLRYLKIEFAGTLTYMAQVESTNSATRKASRPRKQLLQKTLRSTYAPALSKTNSETQMLVEANSKPHGIVIYTDDSITIERLYAKTV